MGPAHSNNSTIPFVYSIVKNPLHTHNSKKLEYLSPSHISGKGKQPAKVAHLSCHGFRRSLPRLALSLLAYNLDNLRRLAVHRSSNRWTSGEKLVPSREQPEQVYSSCCF